MRVPPQVVAYRGVVLLLWALATYNTATCRGLFWDGSSFLVNILERGEFHDFYAARAHVDWLTQAPVLLLAELGVRDTGLLAMAYSATLFGLPTALYHFALARVRGDALLLAAAMAVIAAVYLPTSFFIVGEYNVAFAAVTAAMVVALTTDGRSVRDAAILCVLGVLCLRSYESMIYLGPLLAAAIVWSPGSQQGPAGREPGVRLLAAIAVLAFIGAAVVSAATIAAYWGHPHFAKVRSNSFDFWQNLQFVLPLAGFAISAVIGAIRLSWLAGRGPVVVMGIVAVLVVLSPWYRLLHEHSILYPPAHYLARQMAGVLLAVLLAGMWLHVGWRRQPPAVLAILREAAVSRRLVVILSVLVIAASVPDVALTRLWVDYLERFQALVDDRAGIVRARDLPLLDWPDKLFAQDWSLPAMSAIVSRSPGHGYVLPEQDYLSNPPFEPACGLLPKLNGYGWRS